MNIVSVIYSGRYVEVTEYKGMLEMTLKEDAQISARREVIDVVSLHNVAGMRTTVSELIVDLQNADRVLGRIRGT